MTTLIIFRNKSWVSKCPFATALLELAWYAGYPSRGTTKLPGELQRTASCPLLYGDHYTNVLDHLANEKWTHLRQQTSFAAAGKRGSQVWICAAFAPRKEKIFSWNWIMVKQPCLVCVLELSFFISFFVSWALFGSFCITCFSCTEPPYFQLKSIGVRPSCSM